PSCTATAAICVTHTCALPAARFCFFSLTPRLRSSTLFPYTTLFRSVLEECGDRDPSGARMGAILQVLIARNPAERRPAITAWLRSEEHTSELQSRSDLVCRLLLEKENKARGEGRKVLSASS